ncbi:MAG: hypothetical protein JSV86_04925 [Gemmatimonadota bacterium]|nr:MAG: hypothetical protein JSV86_04925 [Gemmatimonadota bacterium]
MPTLDATARVLATTYQKWLEGYSDETEEDHPILASLKAKGNIDYSGSGVYYQESIKFKRLRLEGYADMDRLEWARKNLYKTQQHEWRGLQLTDAISTKEMRQNKGMEARVKLFEDKLNQMKSDADDDLGAFLYLNGQAAGNEKKLEGFLTMMDYNLGGQLAADVFATAPNGTYGTLSTALGNYGGTGTNAGAVRESNDPEWDFWTPIVVNALNTTTGGGSPASWATHAEELVGAAITHAIRGNNKSHHLDMFCLSRSNYVTLKDQVRTKERIQIDPGPDRSLLVSLGFKGVMMVDGVDCIVDTDVPLTDNQGRPIRALGWNMSKTKMCLLPESGGGDSFWNDSGSFYDPDDKTFKWWLGLWGNLIFKPRYQVMISDIA